MQYLLFLFREYTPTANENIMSEKHFKRLYLKNLYACLCNYLTSCLC